MTPTKKMIYNATVTLVNDFGDEQVLTAEATGFNFSPSGNVLLRTPNHKVLVLTKRLWKRIELVLFDMDTTIPRRKRLEVDGAMDDHYTDVLVVENTGMVQGIVGDKNAPEYLKIFNPEHYYIFEITDEEKVDADAGDVSGELM